jgi:hypothetical protein
MFGRWRRRLLTEQSEVVRPKNLDRHYIVGNRPHVYAAIGLNRDFA